MDLEKGQGDFFKDIDTSNRSFLHSHHFANVTETDDLQKSQTPAADEEYKDQDRVDSDTDKDPAKKSVQIIQNYDTSKLIHSPMDTSLLGSNFPDTNIASKVKLYNQASKVSCFDPTLYQGNNEKQICNSPTEPYGNTHLFTIPKQMWKKKKEKIALRALIS